MALSNTAILVIICLTFASILFIIFTAGVFIIPCVFEGPLLFKLRSGLINLLQGDHTKDTNIDLENQSSKRPLHSDDVSNIALKSFPMESDGATETTPKERTTSDNLQGEAPSDGSSNLQQCEVSGESSDFKSILDDFDRIAATKITEQRLRRMSTLLIKREGDVVETVIARPSESQQSQISEQYDSLSRTLQLQKEIQTRMNENELSIRQVRDPFSDSFISVGGIVVVVKPFHGSNDYEFASLHTGDLLRIIKFYVRENKDDGSIKSIQIANKTKSAVDLLPTTSSTYGEIAKVSEVAKPAEVTDDGTIDGFKQDICIDNTDSNHASIYCTGVLLNTYLDYNIHTNDLSLCVKKDTELAETELLKDFPLNIVSLETTVLKNMLEEDEDN
ncbi:uncharacterized protein SPAPADRAFT_50010 [Spathaspora passalidarum NRRL Y-27907]|uniref:Uncharacterized protein n=1 Tax=Spathaspora passalidarum (strain NRRL Y-27907 / 11-Y1) TaxID=619300 RepID=G3AL46_SPAPN|nr:uncharacterized protein SPAPADRAFT_50010 [Spathaspora passalidarum NRRL Y-27907]EGW33089.1 hypothetical protein SPAPADRAFT_50010 [Spathaspora passalidarum NRRL Y-27907]